MSYFKFVRGLREAMGEGMTLEVDPMEQKKVYELNDDQACEELIQKLKYGWRQWIHDKKPTMEIEVRFKKERRRLEQNDLYWAYLRELSIQIATQMHEEPRDQRVWDEYFKRLFLGVESHMLIDQPVEVVKAHKTLGVKDFSDYLEQVFAWGAEHDIEKAAA